MWPLLLIAAGSLFAVRMFRKAQTAKILNIKIRNIRLNPISRAAIIVDVINPTDTAIIFTSITGDIVVNEFAIATLNYQKNTTIQANSEIKLDLMIKLNPIQLAQYTASIFTQKSKESKIKFVGNISGEGINIPVDTEQTIKL